MLHMFYRILHELFIDPQIVKIGPFLSPPVLMHGGLLGVAFCPSVCLSFRPWLVLEKSH